MSHHHIQRLDTLKKALTALTLAGTTPAAFFFCRQTRGPRASRAYSGSRQSLPGLAIYYSHQENICKHQCCMDIIPEILIWMVLGWSPALSKSYLWSWVTKKTLACFNYADKALVKMYPLGRSQSGIWVLHLCYLSRDAHRAHFERHSWASLLISKKILLDQTTSPDSQASAFQ